MCSCRTQIRDEDHVDELRLDKSILGNVSEEDAISMIRSVIAEVAPRCNISRIYLFGSFARGEAGEDSDIDLCLETFSPFSYWDAAGVGCDITKALGREVDVVAEDPMFPHVRKTMLRDRILVYERNRSRDFGTDGQLLP